MYYLFLDESGDHGLSNIDPNYPVFVLCGVLISADAYGNLEGLMNEIKLKLWNSEAVIFHSTEVRKKEKEFSTLFDEAQMKLFYEMFNNIVISSDYCVIAACIDKNKYIQNYGKLSTDIYEMSLSFVIERTIMCLDNFPDPKQLHIVIEKRGKKEDKKLEQHFQKILANGTGFVNAARIQRLNTKIHFRHKKDNVNGLQLTDMVAYPIARKYLDGDRPSPAYDLIVNKFYSKGERLFGFKVFP